MALEAKDEDMAQMAKLAKLAKKIKMTNWP